MAGNGAGGPPSFANARNTRQRARTAGLDPDYWYAVELAARLPRGKVLEVRFWKRSIALFRGADGQVRALENRCLHRQLPLSLGAVEGCALQCAYHGWKYDGDGRVTEVPHEMFGLKVPRARLRAYPVAERYGLVWLFPGDPARAGERAIPAIPELEGPHAWACVPLAFTWNAHHSMVIDNVSDFTHAHLHRKYRPFSPDATLTRCEVEGDDVHVCYATQVGRGRISGLFVDRDHVDTGRMDLCYQYPYQWSNTGGRIKHWLFVLPIDERTTRAFFLFYFESLKIPFLPWRIPRVLMPAVLRISNALLIAPLLGQDRVAVEAEQAAWERHWDAPPLEPNPAVREFQKVTARKWAQHLARVDRGAR
jgi:phenylpropionate dioxygenase-like ring-hydroxylating dioxygenase large terminal subunit